MVLDVGIKIKCFTIPEKTFLFDHNFCDMVGRTVAPCKSLIFEAIYLLIIFLIFGYFKRFCLFFHTWNNTPSQQ